MTSARIDDAPVRRTQGERSAAMRDRLLNAALQVLREEGYAQASVSRIVERAGVSRGAYLHHFPTKEQLFQALGARLLRHFYRIGGQVALGSARKEDRLRDIIQFIWHEFVRSEDGEAVVQLFFAARTDPQLATILRPLSVRSFELFQHAAEYYFAPATEADPSPSEMMFLLHAALQGMFLVSPVVNADAFYNEKIEALISTVGAHIVPRDVSGPPPKIAVWEEDF